MARLGEGNPYHRAFPHNCVFPLPVGEGQGEGDSRLARQLQAQFSTFDGRLVQTLCQRIKEGEIAQLKFIPPLNINTKVYICRLITGKYSR